MLGVKLGSSAEEDPVGSHNRQGSKWQEVRMKTVEIDFVNLDQDLESDPR